MVETLTPARKVRRESFKGLSRITLADSLTEEVVEDIVAAAPEVQMLYVDVLEDTSLDISLLSDLQDLLTLEIREGSNLQHINLEGIQDLELLIKIEININPEKSFDELDLTPLAGHQELKVVTIAGSIKHLKGLDALSAIPNLESLGFYSLDISELDLSALTGCKKLESIYFGDVGPETPTKPYKLTLPKNVPLKILEISECFSDELELEIDFSFIKSIKSLDSFSLVNCNLTSFDFNALSSLKRIGRLDLSNNKITHLDITPILAMPMFTEKALGEVPFVIDEDVVIQIAMSKEETARIIARPDKVISDHGGSFAIEYEFGHQWLRKLSHTHTIEWI